MLPKLPSKLTKDFKLLGCVPFLAHGWLPATKIQTAELRPIASAYAENLDRVRSAFLFPVMTAMFTSRYQRAVDEAYQAVTGSVSGIAKSAEQKLAIAESANAIFREHATEVLRGDAESVIHRFIGEGTRLIDTIPKATTDDLVSSGIEYMFTSLLVGTWTAFETLAADLWEAALNRHPQVLADLRGGTKGRYATDRADPDREIVEPAELKGKTIKLSWLHRLRYDVGKSMGTIHRERYNFDRLAGIREAYAAAFSDRYSAIDGVLGNEVLDTVALLRNIIVHRAAAADESYVRRAQKLSLAPSLALGEKVTFDGESFCSVMVPMLRCADGLILAVDAWITEG